MSWESQVVVLLSASLLRPFVLVAAAFLVLRVFRVEHPASKHAVWTAILVGMLLLPFLSVMTRHWKLPVLPRKPEVAQFVPSPDDIPVHISAEISKVADTPAFVAPGPISTPTRKLSPESLIAWLYLAGLFAMLMYRTAGWVLLRRVVLRSTRLATPWLRESRDVVAPVALGIVRPAVLLPTSWRDWSTETQTAVLAHEFAHIQRRDALVSSCARFVKCVFWFHPLAWWVSRTVAELAELACDAVALETVPDPAGYSRVLLQFAGGVHVAGYRVALPGLAMAASSGLSKRIDQVFKLSDGNLQRLRRPVAALVLLGVPAICLAATIGFGERATTPRAFTPRASKRPAQLVAQTRTPAPAPPSAGVSKPPVPPVRDRSRTELKFQTASIEIAGPPVSGELCWSGCGGPLSPYPESRNQITYRHFTLKKILLRAYNLKDAQISVPSSLDTIGYNVEATAAPGTTQEQFEIMMRNLLAERLHLTMHEEMRDFSAGYDLVVANSGPRLKESKAPPTSRSSDIEIVLRAFRGETGSVVPPASGDNKTHNLTLSLLAVILARGLKAPVADKTGLTGFYDISLTDLMPSTIVRSGQQGTEVEVRANQPDALASARRGLADLGLTLQEKPQLTLSVLVVDHVDAAPASN